VKGSQFQNLAMGRVQATGSKSSSMRLERLVTWRSKGRVVRRGLTFLLAGLFLILATGVAGASPKTGLGRTLRQVQGFFDSQASGIHWQKGGPTRYGPKVHALIPGAGNCGVELDGRASNLYDVILFCVVAGASKTDITTAYKYFNDTLVTYSGTDSDHWFGQQMQKMTSKITKTLPDMETNYRAGSTHVEFQSSSIGSVSILVEPTATTPSTTTAPPTNLSAPTTTPAGADSLTGYGATTAAWKQLYKRDRNFGGESAYGPTYSTPTGPWPQFTEVQDQRGIIYHYLQSLPGNVSIDTAKADVLREVPPDAVAQSFYIATVGQISGQSCAFWNFQSPTMNRLDGFASCVFEWAYDDSCGAPHDLPDQSDTLTFTRGTTDSTGSC
jgi:hypothetical protein